MQADSAASESEQSEPQAPAVKPRAAAAARKPRAAGPAPAAKAAPAKRKTHVAKVLKDDDEDEVAAVSPQVAPQVRK